MSIEWICILFSRQLGLPQRRRANFKRIAMSKLRAESTVFFFIFDMCTADIMKKTLLNIEGSVFSSYLSYFV